MDDLVERLTICIEGTASVPNIQQAIIDAVARITELEAECTALAHDMERARDAANEYLASLAEAEGRVIAARQQALEEAAKVADGVYGSAAETLRTVKPEGLAGAAVKGNVAAANHIAQAIRALADPLLDRQGNGKDGV